MSKTTNILLSGVGGQGIILASKILATGLMNSGYDVKMSEVHGMAQRGGSVTTQVRFGEKVYSPIIGKGQADILVSFEEMETAKWMEFVKPEGTVVINTFRIPSAPILIGKADYPEGVIAEVKSNVENTQLLDAATMAKELGNVKAMNVIMVGALVKGLGLTDINWEDVIKSLVKEKFIELNVKAFNLGFNAVK
ncbi:MULTISPECIES: indolepyruvate oxidoreductase subunit beta [unclassified Fusibacter]|uniref:indolepyruvate oxidoreductase subunit beta n=1 Tax=unclassified Fusibacter TaxID=2624464 RepID=UPI0010129727|nr:MULTISPECIES: indolepyruvate oxidoreductase subunit beta [unclassified Fusibacter]MCK8061174.1 indolepyruvate oxidoreductase subunit beta [Fusibacter sp. A2]NPE23289.1 indolepyruvate oxidoreductase subunit beta [Fusibacter sp. A1]RXV59331.1 indolepyruvate oxidoreductase subunit beta [Fusibacter sp. A1]